MALRSAAIGISASLWLEHELADFLKAAGCDHIAQWIKITFMSKHSAINIRFQQRRDTSDRFYPAPSKQDFYFLGLYEAGFLNAHQTTGDFAL
jgi:hypothetical protein